MKKEVEGRTLRPRSGLPRSMKFLLVIAFIMYLWYLISALLVPISKYLPLPSTLMLTVYRMINFPISLLGFVLCVSTISTLVILAQFNKEKYITKLLLIESVSIVLYYIIPIISTMLILIFLSLGIIQYLPSAGQISMFLEDLFIFATFMFIITAILNVAMQRLIKIKN